MRVTLALILLTWFVACAPKPIEQKQGRVRLVASSAALLSGVSLNGKIMVYAYEPVKLLAHAHQISGDNNFFDLPNGSWTFFAMGWTGPAPLEGEVRCGESFAVINGKDVTVDLTITKERCGSPPFQSGDFPGPSGQFQKLDIVSCRTLDSVTGASDDCDGNDRFPVGSYQVSLVSYAGPLAGPAPISAEFIHGQCIPAAPDPSSTTSTNLRLPPGILANPLLKVDVKSFLSNDCTGDYEQHRLNGGLVRPALSPLIEDKKFYQDATTSRLFLIPRKLLPPAPILTRLSPASDPTNGSSLSIEAAGIDGNNINFFTDSTCNSVVSGGMGITLTASGGQKTLSRALTSEGDYYYFVKETVGGIDSNCVGPIGVTRDTIAPEMMLVEPSGRTFLRDANDFLYLEVKGWCADSNQIVQVSVGSSLNDSFPCTNNEFVKSYNVSGWPDIPSPQQLIVKAEDAAGNVTEHRRIVIKDYFCDGLSSYQKNDLNDVGTGNVSDPYIICTAAQYTDILQDNTNGCNAVATAACDKHFQIRNDLDFTNENYANTNWGIGGPSTPNHFIGTIIGNEHELKNLHFPIDNTEVIGFVGYSANNAEVAGIRFKNLSISAAASGNGLAVGGVVGKHNGGLLKVKNVRVHGQISSKGDDSSNLKEGTGGIVGFVASGGNVEIENVDVNALIRVGVTAGTFGSVGGLIGHTEGSSNLKNNLVESSIFSRLFQAGGMIGFANVGAYPHTITDSASFSSVTTYGTSGPSGAGGLMGRISGSQTITFSRNLVDGPLCTDLGGGGCSYAAGGLVASSSGLGTYNDDGTSFWSDESTGQTATTDFAGTNVMGSVDFNVDLLLDGLYGNPSGDIDLGIGFFDPTLPWDMVPGSDRARPRRNPCNHPFARSATSFSAMGKGNLNMPYIICNRDQLIDLATSASGCGLSGNSACGAVFSLMSDIDFDGVAAIDPIGTTSDQFSGKFYGNNHIIKNFTIDKSYVDVGFFGFLGEGSLVKELKLQGTVRGQSNVGILAGTAQNSDIERVSTSGVVELNLATGDNLGGVVGLMQGGTVEFTSSNATIGAAVALSGGGSGAKNLGGLIGATEYSSGSAIIQDSFFIGTFENSTDMDLAQRVGGLVGHLQGSYIYRSFVSGLNRPSGEGVSTTLRQIRGNSMVGGLVGQTDNQTSNSFIQHCYVRNMDLFLPGTGGGLIGSMNDTSVFNSFVVGMSYAAAGASKYGFVGSLGGSTSFSNSLWHCSANCANGVVGVIFAGGAAYDVIADPNVLGSYTSSGNSGVNLLSDGAASGFNDDGTLPIVLKDQFPFAQLPGTRRFDRNAVPIH